MKKNRTMRVAVLMLALTLLTCCFVGSTFAKYVSDATGESTATVAKWSFTANTADVAQVDEFTFELFKNVYDIGDDNSYAESDDLNVAEAATGLIAPGTWGFVDIALANASEVTAKYMIEFAITSNDAALPIEFSLEGGADATDWTKTISELDTDFATLNMGANETVTLYWRWAFSTGTEGDVADTADGAYTGTAPSITVSAKVTAEQVN